MGRPKKNVVAKQSKKLNKSQVSEEKLVSQLEPSKKNNCKDAKKSQVAEDSKISKFFKVAATSIKAEVNHNVTHNAKQFYIDELKKTLRIREGRSDPDVDNNNERDTSEIGQENGAAILENDTTVGDPNVDNNEPETIEILQENGAVILENDSVPRNNVIEFVCAGCVQKSDELTQCEIKYKELQKRYAKLTIYCSEVNLKYEDLLKTGKRTGQPGIEKEATFSDDIFSAIELKVLRGVPLEKGKDSTFILQCLKFAYCSDLSVLRNKTIYGKPSSLEVSEEGMVEVPGKDPLTPKKIERIRQLFVERLSACKISALEYGVRVKDRRMNQLLNTGIKNIKKNIADK